MRQSGVNFWGQKNSTSVLSNNFYFLSMYIARPTVAPSVAPSLVHLPPLAALSFAPHAKKRREQFRGVHGGCRGGQRGGKIHEFGMHQQLQPASLRGPGI